MMEEYSVVNLKGHRTQLRDIGIPHEAYMTLHPHRSCYGDPKRNLSVPTLCACGLTLCKNRRPMRPIRGDRCAQNSKRPYSMHGLLHPQMLNLSQMWLSLCRDAESTAEKVCRNVLAFTALALGKRARFGFSWSLDKSATIPGEHPDGRALYVPGCNGRKRDNGSNGCYLRKAIWGLLRAYWDADKFQRRLIKMLGNDDDDSDQSPYFSLRRKGTSARLR